MKTVFYYMFKRTILAEKTVASVLAYITTGDDILKSIVGMLLSILFLGWVLRYFRQPYFIAYIIAGVLLGPGGITLFDDVDTIAQVGSLGLIMQLFFTGIEIEVPALIKNSNVLTAGTAVQVILSLLLMWMVGMQFGWSSGQIILFGCIISMSSSAIIIEYLNKNKELNTRLGTLTTGILIMQDFLLAPMIMILNFIARNESDMQELISAGAVMVLFILLMRKIALKKRIHIPVIHALSKDHELQLFIGLLMCFGFAWITSLLNLSAALGAMFAGMLISQTESTQWLEKSLSPFKIFFLSLFFFSIGLQINLEFIMQHLFIIVLLVLTVLFINSVINTLVFRLLKETWKNSMYAGALLSQIGEFSLVLCTVAKTLHIVDDFSFQLTLAVISISMLLTSGWISFIRRFLFQKLP